MCLIFYGARKELLQESELPLTRFIGDSLSKQREGLIRLTNKGFLAAAAERTLFMGDHGISKVLILIFIEKSFLLDKKRII